jgi:hypothetical protein
LGILILVVPLLLGVAAIPLFVTRFPALGEAFWRAGPERTLRQIEAFLRPSGRRGVTRNRAAAHDGRAIRRINAR